MKRRRGWGTLLCALLGTGCGGSTEPRPRPTVVAIEISPKLDTLVAVSDSRRMTVEVRDELGNPVTNPPLNWRSTDETVAAVGGGLVVAVNNGTTSIIVASGDVADTATIVVKQAPVTLAFTRQPSATVLQAQTLAPAAVVVGALDAMGYVATNTGAISVTVAFDNNLAQGTLSGTTTKTMVNGEATFDDLSIDLAGPAYRLAANAPGFTEETSQSFEVRVRFVELRAGAASTCGVSMLGEAYCWGEGSLGRLGTGSDENEPVPVRVSGGITFRTISDQTAHTCAVDTGGAASCWGSNSVGQLGDGTNDDTSTPTPVTGALAFDSISAFSASCGITPGGDAYCWGVGSSGELGDGLNQSSNTPVAVAGGIMFAQITVGGNHVCGVAIGGTAYCWGNNANGQLGDGDNLPRAVPTPVEGGLAFTSLSAGDDHTCGITTLGALYCWGANTRGQLGTENNDPSSVPVAVMGNLVATSVSVAGTDALDAKSCAVTTTGDAYCWGFGALGHAGITISNVPVRVDGGITFHHVDAGSFHVCGLAVSGAAYCWGAQTAGQLGTGPGGQSSETPVAVVAPKV